MRFDYTYLLFMLPAVILAAWAQFNVKRTFDKYSQTAMGSTLTGADAARKILDANGLQNIAVEQIEGDLNDHYDPKAGVIRLSTPVYAQNSVAAIGVAAHEAGHAVQYAKGYAPIKMRNGILPFAQLGSSISYPIILVGLIMQNGIYVNIGIILFSAVALFQLVTLPVEYNASARAVEALADGGYTSTDEELGVKKVLNAAALTYVAALLTTILMLLRFVLLSRRRD